MKEIRHKKTNTNQTPKKTKTKKISYGASVQHLEWSSSWRQNVDWQFPEAEGKRE